MLSMEFLTQEQAIMVYHVTVPEGTSVEDIMEPTAWAHHVGKLRPDYELIVRPADRTWRAHLEVRSVGKTQASVALLSITEFEAVTQLPNEAIYVAKYRGPSHRYCAVRKDNGSVERTGFQTEDEANTWIMGQMKALAA